MDKSRVCYNCEPCGFTTDNKTDYERHLKRKKHIIRGGSTPEQQTSTYICPYCLKSFRCRTTIYKHRMICKKTDTITTDADTSSPGGCGCAGGGGGASQPQLSEDTTKNFMNMMMMFFQQNTEFQSKMIEMCKHSGISNSHNTTINNTFNMNLFLNEQCKDAMNMKDFVNSIQLNLTDLENVGRLGYVEGMSNILIDNLQKTDLYKRPVHCSDVKRETLYVKENNEWERDGPNHPKMVLAVLAVEHKNVALVSEWAKAHPRCMNSSSRENELYMKLSRAATDGEKEGNIAKVIRCVAKKVALEND